MAGAAKLTPINPLAAGSCDPESGMKIVVGVVAVVLVVASFFADTKWRGWIAARRAERDSSHD